MTTLDDKLLGEKLQYYYSSSEDEGSDDEDGESKTIRDAGVTEPEIDSSADGSSVNTGNIDLLIYSSANKIPENKLGSDSLFCSAAVWFSLLYTDVSFT